MIQKRSIAIVGVGSVGVAAAYALFLQRAASELLLLDKDLAKAEGQALDLMHAQALVGNVEVRHASYSDLGRAQIVIVAAGRSQKRGDTRLDLLRNNADMLRDVLGELDRHAPDAVVMIATNPVDVLTRLATRWSARSPKRIFGTGTTLDSARFRALLGATFDVSPRSVDAYVLGEHGDSQVPIWSQAAIGGIRLVDGPVRDRLLDADARVRIADATRHAARDIIQLKGRTDLAIGAVIASLARAALSDERSVQPLSVALDGEYGLHDVALSVPCVLGQQGVEGRLTPALSRAEVDALHASADVLRAAERSAGVSA